jgi:hypothetical protein
MSIYTCVFASNSPDHLHQHIQAPPNLASPNYVLHISVESQHQTKDRK